MAINGIRKFVQKMFPGCGQNRRGSLKGRAKRQIARGFETCEQRVLLTVDMNLLQDADKTAPYVDYQTMVADTGRIYFTPQDGVHGREVWTSNGTAAGTHLVKDLIPGLRSSNPVLVTTQNDSLYFVAYDDSYGLQFWKTDGTEAGTIMLTNLVGGKFQLGESYKDDCCWVGDTLYFTARDNAHGMEMWKTDGTPLGTMLRSDLVAGGASSTPYGLTNVNGTLFFAASDANNNSLLYKIDNGTGLPVLVKNVAPSDPNTNPSPDDLSDLANVNGKLFFTANDGVHGMELWVSDGTTAGTFMLKDINPNGDSLHVDWDYPTFVPLGNGVAFEADDGVHGGELWVSDGTEGGTRMLKDINPNGSAMAQYDHYYMRTINGQLYFPANDGVHGTELWGSDGTEAGTRMILDINPGSGGSRPNAFVGVGGTVFFLDSDGVHGEELWKTDGTAGGTTLVKDIYPGSQGGIDFYEELIVVGAKVAFVADDSIHGSEVWVSDGTAAGTTLLKDINSGVTTSRPTELVASNGGLLFMDYITGTGTQLWKSDLTAAGTTALGTLDVSTGDDNFTRSAVVGSTFYYTVQSKQLWKSDGTPVGTVLVKDFFPDIEEPTANNLFLDDVISAGGAIPGVEVFLVVGDNIHGKELWKSNGTAAGTTLVKDIRSGSEGSYPENLMVVGNELYFFADDGVHGKELWKSDGTTNGTTLVKDIFSGTGSSNSYLTSYYVSFGGKFYFAADDGVHGVELWVTDGTSGGTQLVQDIAPGAANASFFGGTVFNGALYLSVNDGINGGDLWKFDGTIGGGTRVKDFNPGSTDSMGGGWSTVYNGKLLFTAGSHAHGYDLWRTDGTEAGTVLVANFGDGSYLGIQGPLVISGGGVYFVALDATHGRELWRTDGTTAGTSLVKETIVGTKSLNLTALTDVNGVLYFFANNGQVNNLYDLWKTDGTAAGTVVVKSSTSGSEPIIQFKTGVDIIVAPNGTAYVSFDDTLHGTEWWSMRFVPESVGVFRNGTFYLDADGSNGWKQTGAAVTDKSFAFGITGDLPVSGDWNGDSAKDIGVFRNGTWYLDQNGNYKWNGAAGGDLWFNFGTAGDTPVTGDWNGDGKTDVGVYRNGAFYLDLNGNHKWDAGDVSFKFGNPGDKPVTGDWNGDGKTDVGVVRGATWYLDQDGSRKWSAGDVSFNFGTSGDLPVTGDWNADGKTDVGVFRNGFYYLDKDGNRKWNASDVKFGFGTSGDLPVFAGTWNLGAPSVVSPSPAPSSAAVVSASETPAVVIKASESALVENAVSPEVTAKVKKHTHKGKS